MREFESRRRLKRRLYSLPVIVVLALLCVFSVKGAYSIIKKERESAKEAEALKLKFEGLGEREKFLEEEIRRLGTVGGIEQEIKSKFNVAQSGEYVALIVDDSSGEATTTPENLHWWERLWDAIIGH